LKWNYWIFSNLLFNPYKRAVHFCTVFYLLMHTRVKNAVNPIHKAIQKTIYFWQSLHQC